jgi:hypothetical protein
MIATPSRRPRDVHRRGDPNAAFTSGEVVLPRGDGTPSRFRLSFAQAPGGDDMLFSIR